MSELNTTALAFIGDAVYELYIRTNIATGHGKKDADSMHREAVRFVRAESQAASVKEMLKEFLSDEEADIVRRARNHKTPNRSRNAGALEYKMATAFEALIGSLYLAGRTTRAEEIMAEAVRLISAEGGKDHE